MAQLDKFLACAASKEAESSCLKPNQPRILRVLAGWSFSLAPTP